MVIMLAAHLFPPCSSAQRSCCQRILSPSHRWPSAGSTGAPFCRSLGGTAPHEIGGYCPVCVCVCVCVCECVC